MKQGTGWGLSEAGWLTIAILGLALAWDASGLDRPLAHLAGSAEGFPWRDHWLLDDVLHDGARRVAWLLVVGLCVGVWWPVGPLTRLTFAGRLQLTVATLAAAVAVSLLKLASPTSCPWDLAEFGGFVSYASHWRLQPDGGAGHCFPAGHASSGFSFLAGYFAFRPAHSAIARRWLAASLLAGTALGVAQQWRGAHFMSHTLWSAAVCWMAACLISHAWSRSGLAEKVQ